MVGAAFGSGKEPVNKKTAVPV